MVEVGYRGHVALGLDDQCAEPERAHAVLDTPAPAAVDSPPGNGRRP